MIVFPYAFMDLDEDWSVLKGGARNFISVSAVEIFLCLAVGFYAIPSVLHARPPMYL
jgi:hypothetical protein